MGAGTSESLMSRLQRSGVFIGRFPGPASALPASRPMPIPTQAKIERAFSARKTVA